MPDASNFDSFFTAAIIGFVVVLAVIIVIIVLNVVRVRKSGHNPLTLQSDIATRLVDSDLLSPRATKAQQLAELDALLAAGQITEAERTSARAAILSGTDPQS